MNPKEFLASGLVVTRLGFQDESGLMTVGARLKQKTLALDLRSRASLGARMSAKAKQEVPGQMAYIGLYYRV